MSQNLSLNEAATIAYRNLIETCRSPKTRSMYAKALRYFMSYLRLPSDAYNRLLDKDTKTIQMNVCDFVVYLRKKGLASASVSTYVAAVSKFYAMNDITLNWRRIKSYQGESERQIEDRPYIHSEIQTLLNASNPRNKAIILVMCSGGLRVGAIETLRIKDLEPIDKYNIYKINVYATSRKSKYFTFCTPEARKEIDNYLEWRKRFGERITEEAPLFRKEHRSNTITNNEKKVAVAALQTGAIRWLIASLLKDTGIRPVIPLLEDKKQSRSPVMQCHGFRKFFETNAYKAGMDHMYLRRLMGQKSGLEDSYLKLSEEELVEGDSKHTGYIGIIDQLTINEENKLKRKVKILTDEQTGFNADIRSKVEGLEQQNEKLISYIQRTTVDYSHIESMMREMDNEMNKQGSSFANELKEFKESEVGRRKIKEWKQEREQNLQLNRKAGIRAVEEALS